MVANCTHKAIMEQIVLKKKNKLAGDGHALNVSLV